MVGPLRHRFGIEMTGCTDLSWDAPKRRIIDAKRRDGCTYQAIHDDTVMLYGEGNAPSPSTICRYPKFKAEWLGQMWRNNRIDAINEDGDAFELSEEYFEVLGRAGEPHIDDHAGHQDPDLLEVC